MPRKYPFSEGDSLFDGVCHRPYNPDIDGWLNEQPESEEYPSVQMAQDILLMFDEIKRLRKENWELRKERNNYKSLFFYNREA